MGLFNDHGFGVNPSLVVGRLRVVKVAAAALGRGQLSVADQA